MRNDNGRFSLRWESTSTVLDAGFDYREEAVQYANTFMEKGTILNVVLFDTEERTFEVLKGKMPKNYANAIPVYDEVRMSRRQMLMLERVLLKVASGDWHDMDDEAAKELLVGVTSVREALERDQDWQRRLTEATK